MPKSGPDGQGVLCAGGVCGRRLSSVGSFAGFPAEGMDSGLEGFRNPSPLPPPKGLKYSKQMLKPKSRDAKVRVFSVRHSGNTNNNGKGEIQGSLPCANGR